MYHEKLWRVHNAKDDNQSNKFSYDNYGLWKENLNSYGQQANNHLSSVINEHIHTLTKKTTPASAIKKTMTFGFENTYGGV